jgi:hypothetical protein
MLLVCLLPGLAACAAQAAPPAPEALSPAQAQTLVEHALANELNAAQDHGHPMRYVLRKTSPRLTTTKQIVETRDGAVARLISINDAPLSAADTQKEQARLDGLLADPGLQRHRKQSEDTDTGRALKVLRALPRAFIYQYASPDTGPSGKLAKFTFRPSPDFDPPDFETVVLTAMSGEMWIDVDAERVVRLNGHLDRDADLGWGFIGKLYKGGWIAIEQAGAGGGQWRTVRFQMQMSGRVFFRMRAFDTTEVESHFEPVPIGLSYGQAIQMLLPDAGSSGAGR